MKKLLLSVLILQTHVSIVCSTNTPNVTIDVQNNDIKITVGKQIQDTEVKGTIVIPEKLVKKVTYQVRRFGRHLRKGKF